MAAKSCKGPSPASTSSLTLAVQLLSTKWFLFSEDRHRDSYGAESEALPYSRADPTAARSLLLPFPSLPSAPFPTWSHSASPQLQRTHAFSTNFQLRPAAPSRQAEQEDQTLANHGSESPAWLEHTSSQQAPANPQSYVSV